MCGIVGYMGHRQAEPVLLNSLKRLEYRGYDSSGIAVCGKSIQVFKDKVRVEALQSAAPCIEGNEGIGHTRWATHGEPSRVNAHPHCDCSGKIAVVHNGVINNYLSLKEQLISEGHEFLSETDTEVISHLIEKYYCGDIEKAVAAALRLIEGSYAIAVVTSYEPTMIVARNGNPLILGMGDNETIVASDIPALLDYTDRVIYLEDGDIAIITMNGVKIKGESGEVTRAECQIAWNSVDVEKNGYEHFMLKEIHEEPRIIRESLSQSSIAANPEAETALPIDESGRDLLILACGTSYHAGLVGKYIMEELLDIPTRVELASEIDHRDRTMRFANVIAISQSGETSDVLTALKKLKEAGSSILAITNSRGSSVSRMANKTVYTSAGPEVSVAATKSSIAQLAALYQLVLNHPKLNVETGKNLISEMRRLPHRLQQILDNDRQITGCAMYLSEFEHAFFVGRGINYPVALEGALKLKEISYIHAEGYAAGELKHGPFSLLQPSTPVVAIVAKDKTYDSMLTNIKEMKSRKAPVIAVIGEDDDVTAGIVDFVIRVPKCSSILSPIMNAIPLQLLAYYTAKYRACPIDFPRNLAKSVTVE